MTILPRFKLDFANFAKYTRNKHIIMIVQIQYAQNNCNIQSKYSVKLMNSYAFIAISDISHKESENNNVGRMMSALP